MQGKRSALGVVANEKWAFRSPSTTITNFTFTYIYVCVCVCLCLEYIDKCIYMNFENIDNVLKCF